MPQPVRVVVAHTSQRLRRHYTSNGFDGTPLKTLRPNPEHIEGSPFAAPWKAPRSRAVDCKPLMESGGL
jgi:hypothetical protein